MTYRCQHFEIRELVDEQTHKLFKEHFGERHYEGFLWRLFDEGLLRSIDELRDKFGSCTINDWHRGGNFNWSGLRTPLSPWYSEGSRHSVGGAFDLKFKNFTADQIRDSLRSVCPSGIKRIELGTSWVHVDDKETGKAHVHFFNA